MREEKIEPRLLSYIGDQKRRASAAGQPEAAVDDVPIAVTISHHDHIRSRTDMERASEAARLGEQVRQSQQPILAKLSQWKVRDTTVHTLANAVTTHLTPRQIEEIAQLDEVEICSARWSTKSARLASRSRCLAATARTWRGRLPATTRSCAVWPRRPI